MERNFPIILCELRKERGLSQKEAAAKLGISQALLSHYEKGIRECGQSFLIKVADFYGVTCDYLLGRSTSRNTSGALEHVIEDSKNDITPSTKTFIKAGILLNEIMRKENALEGVKIDMLLAVALYKVILLQAAAGNLPKNWAGRANVDGKICCTPVYLGIAEYSAYSAINPKKNKNPMPDAPVPDAIKTLVAAAEDFIVKDVLEKTPPMPTKYMR